MLWTVVFFQVAMGGVDTLYHHELTERLAWRPSQTGELRLHGVRNLAYAIVVCLRIGLVLAADGSVLSRMLTPFEFGLGGPFGTGRHWMSWIHRDDLVRLIVHAIATPALAGPVNGTAPTPVTNATFAATLGRALARPSILPVPAAPLRLALGAFAEELLLSGQRVTPQAALKSGFRFTYPAIDDALAAIVGRARPADRKPSQGGAIRSTEVGFPVHGG
jgi:hypothetical protein